MNNIEMVEKLREQAKVSYEEAKEALEQNNWDILDAMIYLERKGKVDPPGMGEYSTETEPKMPTNKGEDKDSKWDINDKLNPVFSKIKTYIVRGLATSLDIISPKGKHFSIPLTILVIILLIVAPSLPFLLVLAIIGYFLGVRYQINSHEDETTEITSEKEDDHKTDLLEEKSKY